jgi:hypothetical protein
MKDCATLIAWVHIRVFSQKCNTAVAAWFDLLAALVIYMSQRI